MLAMPLLILNLGAEMVYILEQRLGAQRVQASKSSRVLLDVLKTMYSPSFVDELFKPQAMYSSKATRQIFDKLAHSSIMRLNESSMDKLYDLMVMGFKHQMLCCAAPEQLMHVTRKHLGALTQIAVCAGSKTVADLVNHASTLLEQVHGALPLGEWFMLKHMLASFFQGRKVKVSLLLQSHMQAMDGTIALRNTGPLPRSGVPPGTIRFFRDGKVSRTARFASEVGAACTPFNHYEDKSPHALGANLYQKPNIESYMETNRQTNGALGLISNSAPGKTAARDPNEGKEEAPASEAKGEPPEGVPSISPAEAKAHAAAELNLLASLLGAAAKDTEQTAGEAAAAGTLSSLFDPEYDVAEAKVQTIVIDGTENRHGAAKLMADFDAKGSDPGDKGSGSGGGGGGYAELDDLLSLMDGVALGK